MVDRKFRLARIWSNNELKKYSSIFEGDIINVSGGDDFDKVNSQYSDYFINKRTYSISNYKSDKFRGYKGTPNEIVLDLTQPLDESLIGRYDVVYNHTTLEHIYDVKTAVKNLCLLSKDVVILVVPFSQVFHESEYFGDYWRFTPSGIKSLLKENEFEMVYCSQNNDFNSAVYLFCIATRNAAVWSEKLHYKSYIVGNKIGGTPSVREFFQVFSIMIKKIFKKLN